MPSYTSDKALIWSFFIASSVKKVVPGNDFFYFTLKIPREHRNVSIPLLWRKLNHFSGFENCSRRLVFEAAKGKEFRAG